MAKRSAKRGKSPKKEPSAAERPSSSIPSVGGSRRQDLLVPEDNMGVEQRPLILPTARQGSDDFSSDDDDDFIDMERIDQAAQRQEIMVVDRAEKRRREAEVKEYMRCHLQRIRHKKDNVHKLHLFAVVSNLTKRMSTSVKLAKSLESSVFPVPSPGQDVTAYLKSLNTKSWLKLKNFESFTTLSPQTVNDFYSVERMKLVAACVCATDLDAVVATVVNLRVLGFTVRLVYAFKAVAKGETNVHITEEMMESFVKNGYRFSEDASIKGRRTEAAEKKLKIGVYDKKRSKGKAAIQKKAKVSESEAEMESDSTSNEDEDFENEDEIETVKSKKPKIEKKKRAKPAKKAPKPSASSKRDESMDTSETTKPFEKITAKSYYFVEVWDENELMWIDFDPLKGIVNDAESITKNLDKELDYVFAFDSDGGFRDVSIKYIKNFVLPERRQSRIEESYIYQLMQRKPIRAQLYRNLLEDELTYAKMLSMPLPRTKGGYKNHLFYALEEHLKVKEALYPPNATPVDEHNIFDVHSRKNVGMLDIDLRWRRKGYQVKEGEEPYKLIAGRSRSKKKEAPKQKLFGPWQLERTPAPELDEDGNIPVNSNGNVYLYKSWMTPKDCFHLKVNGHGEEIAKIADVENVQAIVGWTFKKAKYFPVMYGVVVKKEDLPAIMKAKKQFYAKRMNKKSEKRVRKTILPYVRKDKARQAFFKSFYRATGSIKNNDLEYLHFNFDIPNASSFSTLKIDTFVDGMPLSQYQNGLSEHIVEIVDRYKKRQAEEERLAPKKVVSKPPMKTSPGSSDKAETNLKNKSNGPTKGILKSKDVTLEKVDDASSNRRITRSSARASMVATVPSSPRKPLAPTQQDNILDELESQSEMESDEEFPRRQSIPASNTPSGKELKKKQAKRGGRGRGGKKRL